MSLEESVFSPWLSSGPCDIRQQHSICQNCNKKKMLCKIQYHYQFLQSRADVDCCVFVLSLSYLDIRWKNKFWGKSMEILPVGTLNVTLPKQVALLLSQASALTDQVGARVFKKGPFPWMPKVSVTFSTIFSVWPPTRTNNLSLCAAASCFCPGLLLLISPQLPCSRQHINLCLCQQSITRTEGGGSSLALQ